MSTKTIASCPSCGKRFLKGYSWAGANYCRALLLLEALPDHPGMSTAELGEACGISYGDAAKGMLRLRELDAVRYESEERDTGGVRYRFYPRADHEQQLISCRVLARQLEEALVV